MSLLPQLKVWTSSTRFKLEALRSWGWLGRSLAAQLLDLAPVPICVVRGNDLIVELANHAYLELARDKTVIGKPLHVVMPSAFAAVVVHQLSPLLSGASRVEEDGRFITHADDTGDGREWDWVFYPLESRVGSTRRAAILGHDVTGTVRARRACEAARVHAEQACRAKDEFVAQLAHELRSPLSPITSALELMRLANNPELARVQAILERQTKSLARLVDDLLEVTRGEVGRLYLKRQTVWLEDIVDQALEAAAPILQTRRHELRVRLAPGLAVHGDASRLVQVMSNLVSNAAKYTEDAGTIVISGARIHHEVVLSVRDSGIGIAADMLPRVFDKFVQADGAAPRSRGGLGLGLHIVQMIVKEHGGHVEAHSDGLGRGSEFTVRIPAAVVHPAAAGCARVLERDDGMSSETVA